MPLPTTSRRPSRRRTSATVPALLPAVLLAVLLSGCQGGDSTAAPTSRGSSTGASQAPDDAATDPTPTDSASVAPAAGPLLELPEIRLHAPDGWTDVHRTGDLQVYALAGRKGIAVNRFVAADASSSLLEQARLAAGIDSWRGKPSIEDPVTVAGVPMYHLTGRDSLGDPSEEFGAIRDGQAIAIHVKAGARAAERAETIESILASVEWTTPQ